MLYDTRTLKNAYKSLLKLSDTESPSRDQLHAKFLADIHAFQLQMTKQDLIEVVTRQELEYFHTERLKLQESIEAVRSDIEALQTQLEGARRRKRSKMEYDQIATDILKVQSRDRTEMLIKKTTDEIALLKQERQIIVDQQEVRQKHFSAVVASMVDMMSVISQSRLKDEMNAKQGTTADRIDDDLDYEEGAITDSGDAMETC